MSRAEMDEIRGCVHIAAAVPLQSRGYTGRCMFSEQLTYVVGDTPVHTCDARVKIALLLAVSIGVVATNTWPVLAGFTLAVAAALAVARVPLARLNRMLVPVYVMAGFSVLFNVVASPNIQGATTGAFFAVRMVVLVAASFVVCLTTTTSQLLEAFRWYISPLRALRVPVDDIAFTLALSVRFIPQVEREFMTIRAAQVSRGADFGGSLVRAAKTWAAAFASLFIGLFRHADALAQAMDARCYGAVDRRTRLGDSDSAGTTGEDGPAAL